MSFHQLLSQQLFHLFPLLFFSSSSLLLVVSLSPSLSNFTALSLSKNFKIFSKLQTSVTLSPGIQQTHLRCFCKACDKRNILRGTVSQKIARVGRKIAWKVWFCGCLGSPISRLILEKWESQLCSGGSDLSDWKRRSRTVANAVVRHTPVLFDQLEPVIPTPLITHLFTTVCHRKFTACRRFSSCSRRSSSPAT